MERLFSVLDFGYDASLSENNSVNFLLGLRRFLSCFKGVDKIVFDSLSTGNFRKS